MTAPKKEDAKALTADEKIDAIVALLVRNGFTIPAELKPAKR